MATAAKDSIEDFESARALFFRLCLEADLVGVEKMLDDGYRVNRGDDDLYTALHRVCERWESNEKHLPIAELLVARGANVDADNPATDGWTPLHLAAWAGKADACSFLLSEGATSFGDWYGQTPLQVAVYAGHEEAASVLRGQTRSRL